MQGNYIHSQFSVFTVHVIVNRAGDIHWKTTHWNHHHPSSQSIFLLLLPSAHVRCSRLEMPRRRFQIPMLYGVTRNIHLFDGSGNYLGGKSNIIWFYPASKISNRQPIHSGGYQNPTPHITKELYYEMCEEFLTFRPNNTQWYLHDLRDDNSFGQQIPRDRTSISSGRYVVLGPGMYQFISCSVSTNQRI